jgi:hypothetical protein
MYKSRTLCFGTCLATLFLLTHCASDNRPMTSSQGGSGNGGTSAQGGTTSAGGSGGAASAGGTTSAGGSGGSGGSTATGGTTTAGGAGGTSAGGSGGAKATGGTTTAGGAGGTSAGGAGGTTPNGGSSAGGVAGGGAGGTTPTGGTVSTGGTSGPRTDCLGKALAKPGDSSTDSKAYLNLGDMRLINNRWGADARNCGGASYKIFVGTDNVVGYDFNRPTCGGEKGYPDYPEVEFGVAPFGANSPDLTSPACSSTTLLPIQLKNLTSASLNMDGFNSTYQKPSYYDTNFEFWISKQNPLTASDPGVYAEIIVFLSWNGSRMSSSGGWPCDKSGSVTAGGNSFTLCHQSDSWSNNRWRFFNFNLNGGPKDGFSGNSDIKAILDYVRSKYSGFTDDMWLTRIEMGTEVDDNTQGTAKINNLTFEINGTKKSIELAK